MLRLIAAFQMLQGHTLAALLAPELRHGAAFVAWSKMRGLTAVAFLFTAGMSLYLAAARDQLRVGRLGPSRKRVWRALRLIALGYLLHASVLIPGLALGSMRELFAVDVLQCTGVSLLCLEGLLAASRRSGHWLGACGVCLVLFFVGTPLAHALASRAPLGLAGYLGTATGALFPLWPWAGHVCAGALCAGWVSEQRGSSAWRLAGLGVALLLVAWRLGTVEGEWSVVVDHVERLGAVTCVAAFLAWALRADQRPPRRLAALATHSLFLYVFHILLVYGRPWGLVEQIGPTLGLASALGVTACVIALSAGAALGYRRRHRSPDRELSISG
jgi:uncharacterized membrane protein